MDVGERFLQNAEEHELGGARHAFEIVGNVGDDFDAAALGETFGVPARGRRDSDFIEQRRMQVGARWCASR